MEIARRKARSIAGGRVVAARAVGQKVSHALRGSLLGVHCGIERRLLEILLEADHGKGIGRIVEGVCGEPLTTTWSEPEAAGTTKPPGHMQNE